MRFSLALALSALAVGAAAGPVRRQAPPPQSGTVHMVDVGLNNLTFTPDTVAANAGDTIMFVFHPKNQCVPRLLCSARARR
jgi:plastocyanin